MNWKMDIFNITWDGKVYVLNINNGAWVLGIWGRVRSLMERDKQENKAGTSYM